MGQGSEGGGGRRGRGGLLFRLLFYLRPRQARALCFHQLGGGGWGLGGWGLTHGHQSSSTKDECLPHAWHRTQCLSFAPHNSAAQLGKHRALG